MTRRLAHINAQGRIIIPADLRKQHGIDLDSDLEIESTDTGIELRPAKKKCSFCKAKNPSENLFGYPLCISCLDKLKTVL